MESHGGSALDISELEVTGGGVLVNIEELGNGCAVLREIGAFTTLVPLLIVINHVVGGGSEKLVQFLILEDGVQDPNLINGGLSSSISNSGSGGSEEEEEMDLPDQSLVEHEETEGSVADKGSSPAVI